MHGVFNEQQEANVGEKGGDKVTEATEDRGEDFDF